MKIVLRSFAVAAAVVAGTVHAGYTGTGRRDRVRRRVGHRECRRNKLVDVRRHHQIGDALILLFLFIFIFLFILIFIFIFLRRSGVGLPLLLQVVVDDDVHILLVLPLPLSVHSRDFERDRVGALMREFGLHPLSVALRALGASAVHSEPYTQIQSEDALIQKLSIPDEVESEGQRGQGP